MHLPASLGWHKLTSRASCAILIVYVRAPALWCVCIQIAAHSRESEPLTRSLALLIVLSSIAALALVVARSPGSRAGSAQAPLDIVISEVAWSGTACSAYDE